MPAFLLENLDAYWKLDGLAEPINSLTLTNTNGVTFSSGGLGTIGDVAHFASASSQQLSRADNALISGGDRMIHIFGWLYLTSKPAASMTFIAQGATTGGVRSWALVWDQATDRILMQGSSTGAAVDVSRVNTVLGSPSTGTWYFFDFFHDPTANLVGIAHNASAHETTAYSLGLFDSGADITLGGRAGQYLNGRLWGWGFRSRKLTDAERTYLYMAGAPSLSYPWFDSETGMFSLTGQDALAHRTVVFDMGAFSLTGQAAGLYAGRAVDGDEGSFALTGQDATLLKTWLLPATHSTYALTGQDAAMYHNRYFMTADHGSFALTGQAATLTVGRGIAAGYGGFALTGQDIEVERSYILQALVASFTLGALNFETLTEAQLAYLTPEEFENLPATYAEANSHTELLHNWKTVGAHGSFALSGQDVTFQLSKGLTGEPGSFALSGQAAGLKANRFVIGDHGSFALSGQDASLYFGRVMSAGNGLFALSGQDARLMRSRLMSADHGSYALTGQDADGSHAWKIIAGQGAYTLSGQEAALRFGRSLLSGQGAFLLSGQTAALRRASRMSSDNGTYALGGQDATLFTASQMQVATGFYALSGQAAILTPARRIAGDTGLYALTGVQSGLYLGTRISASSGSYSLLGQDVLWQRTGIATTGQFALSGQDAQLIKHSQLEADQGAYVLSGQDVSLRHMYRLIAGLGLYELAGQDVLLVISRNLAGLVVEEVELFTWVDDSERFSITDAVSSFNVIAVAHDSIRP